MRFKTYEFLHFIVRYIHSIGNNKSIITTVLTTTIVKTIFSVVLIVLFVSGKFLAVKCSMLVFWIDTSASIGEC